MIKERNILVETAMYDALQSMAKWEQTPETEVAAFFEALDKFNFECRMLSIAVKINYGLDIVNLAVDTINKRVVATLSDTSKHYAQF